MEIIWLFQSLMKCVRVFHLHESKFLCSSSSCKKIDITDKKYFLIDYVPVEKVSPQRIQDALLILNEVEKCTNTQVFSLWRLMEKVRTLKSYNSENV